MSSSSNDFAAAFDAERDPLEPAADIVDNTADPSKAGDESESAQTLDILKQIQAEMQSIHGRLDDLEKGQRALESGQATPVDPGSSSLSRWTDHMDGLKVPMYMYTELNFDDPDKEDEKENEGMKVFNVSKSTEEFLNHHFSARVENPTCRQW